MLGTSALDVEPHMFLIGSWMANGPNSSNPSYRCCVLRAVCRYHGDHLIVGDPAYREANNYDGQAFIFEANELGEWNQVQRFEIPNGQRTVDDYFGWSVSIGPTFAGWCNETKLT